MGMPTRSYEEYGAPSSVFLNLTWHRTTSGVLRLDASVILLGKTPTLIGEASSVVFKVAPKLQSVGNGSAWRIDKIGSDIDPEAVIKGGNQFNHGSWNGWTVQTVVGHVAVKPLDTVIINPV